MEESVETSLMAQRVHLSTHTYSGAELIILSALASHADDRGVVSEISVPASGTAIAPYQEKAGKWRPQETDLLGSNFEWKSGAAVGVDYSVYELNLQIFNRSKRSVECRKGGVRLRSLRSAALEARLAPAEKTLIPDVDGGLIIEENREKSGDFTRVFVRARS